MVMRLQSALEYLTTYGWAVLVIAVALVILFSLGLFNGSALAPKASAGSCYVSRPSGLEITQEASLVGSCTGEIPKYVAQFNKQTSYITAAVSNQIIGSSGFTVAGWIYLYGGTLGGACEGGILGNWNGAALGFQINAYSCQGKIAYISGCCTSATTVSFPPGALGTTLPYDKWEFFAVTYNPSTGAASSYLNNQSLHQTLSNGLSFGSPPNYFIGSYAPYPDFGVNGILANVQLYNVSLSSNGIAALYLEGIGGAPVDVQNIVGWWPLNGNANDYSGNNNAGSASNVVYNSNWYLQYTPP